MMLLKLNDKIINLDRVAIVQLKENGSLWIDFDGNEKGASDLRLSLDEGARLWAYLRTRAIDVIAFEVDEGATGSSPALERG
ncbi:MAG TPA: hypothetical protein VGN86_02895 [Pyrinomonadaceae bacterium]|nr:hypothetical protein [Pyrinomonadaceae bacterium]